MASTMGRRALALVAEGRRDSLYRTLLMVAADLARPQQANELRGYMETRYALGVDDPSDVASAMASADLERMRLASRFNPDSAAIRAQLLRGATGDMAIRLAQELEAIATSGDPSQARAAAEALSEHYQSTGQVRRARVFVRMRRGI